MAGAPYEPIEASSEEAESAVARDRRGGTELMPQRQQRSWPAIEQTIDRRPEDGADAPSVVHLVGRRYLPFSPRNVLVTAAGIDRWSASRTVANPTCRPELAAAARCAETNQPSSPP